MEKKQIFMLVPVLLAFFVMGYVDLVGTATTNIKEEFQLSDKVTNLLTSMVFFWFLVLSVPTGMLMNKIGRRKTVIISLVVTLLAMITPLIANDLPIMLISFALLGIGNTLMQVSLNPLVTNVVSGKQLASSLTLGQFFKAIASFLAPIIASWAAFTYGNWRLLYPLFAAISLIPIIWLSLTPIKEMPVTGKPSTFVECFKLLGDKRILILFIGILVHVGIDVGTNLTAPKILIERLDMLAANAVLACFIYFIARTAGCFSGAFILSKISPKTFFIASVCIMIVGILGLLIFNTVLPIYVCIAMLGIGNSNIFPIIFSQAMQFKPTLNNEVSGLMIMGISGGAIFPFFMGVASDAMHSQNGAVIVIAICIAYLMYISQKINK